MVRLASLLLMTAAALMALAVFNISQETQLLESELLELRREILREQESIHVARAEWSYLTRPARVAELARRHLDYRPLAAERFIQSSDLRPRDDLMLADYGEASPTAAASP